MARSYMIDERDKILWSTTYMGSLFVSRLKSVAGNLRVQLKERSVNESNETQYGIHSLPAVPSDFLACHHFPSLLRMSSISPLANEISFGSSALAVSVKKS